MVKELSINGYDIIISTTENPNDASLVINGIVIPIQYYSSFKGWKVPHTLFGLYFDLETLARHMIISRPDLGTGHGHDS